MRTWVPVSTSPKGRLAICALAEFGRRPYKEVTVGELAAGASVTTGALYHHFGSKLGLYTFVRSEAERRLLDRMEGAAAAGEVRSAAVALSSALLVGFDFAVDQGFLHLLGEDPQSAADDPVADVLAKLSHAGPTPLGRAFAAAWRATLMAVFDGESQQNARAALRLLTSSADLGPRVGQDEV